MPPRKKSLPVKAVEPEPRQPYWLPNDAPWGGFINIRLTDEQIEEFRLWDEENGEYVSDYFPSIVAAGCKASFSYDTDHECYILALTGALMGGAPGSRFCSTSRGSSMPEVISLTVWKHVVLAKGDYGNYSPKHGSFLSFG